MNIGILYPRSAAHPAITMEFMDGIKTFLKLSNLLERVNIKADNAGYGGMDKEVKEKIEKMIIVEEADMLVLYIDQKIFTQVKPLLESYGKLVIIVNPGADYPQSWAPSANIVHLHLNHAFLCWLTGQLAADEKNTQAIMATSFYDCGYLHSAMMVNNFNLHGGQIMFNYVNNQAYKEGFHINELLNYLNTDKDTSKLLCIYDELPARLVYAILNEMEAAEKLQLFVSPMMLQPGALENNKNGFKFSVRGYMPWIAGAGNAANKMFIQTILAQSGKPASVFSLLGWEIALLLQKVIESSVNPGNGKAIVENLLNTTINSPRGELVLNKQTQHYTAPVIKAAINNHSVVMETQQVNDCATGWIDFVSNPPGGVVSGWTNTYLCY